MQINLENIYIKSFINMIFSLFNNARLIYVLSRRDVQSKYIGSVLGGIWNLLTPLVLLITYGFVFGKIFKVKLSSGQGSDYEFGLYLFLGILLYNILSECLVRSPELIIHNKSLVKNIVFPLEILPWTLVLAASFQALMGLAIWFIAYFYFYGYLPLTIILFPLVYLSYLMFIQGIVWTISSLGVYVRDLAQTVALLATVWMYLSPIFYSISDIPDKYFFLLYLNPLTYYMTIFKDLLFSNDLSHLYFLPICFFISSTVSTLGYLLFQRLRKGFSDVI